MAELKIDYNMKILVVDDFSTMRRIVKNLLKQIGFANAIEADNGASALQKMKQEKVDFIVCDWNMPVMTGIDFLRAVRADEATKEIPFLMVTAEAEKANIVEAVQSGVSQYILKPFSAEVLKQKIEAIFEKLQK